jgi:hypothetical protein
MPLDIQQLGGTYTVEKEEHWWSGSNLLIVLFISFCSIAVSAIFVITYGDLFAAVACIAGILILFLSIYRLEWGFYLFLAMVLLFDQFFIPGFEPITYKVMYFRNLKEIPYVPSLSAGVVNPLELQMMLIIGIWFIVASFKKNLKLVGIPMWGFALAFYLMLVFSFLYGLKRGGDFLPAVWEIRALFYLGVCYVMVPQVIRTKEQLYTLMWVIITCISYKAFQGFSRYAYLGFTFNDLPTLTNHEDPKFFVDLIVLLIAFVMFDVKSKQRTTLLWLLLLLVLGFYAGQRRATYAAIVPAFAAFIAIVPGKQQKLFVRTLAPIFIFMVIYCAIFWNIDNKFAAPVKLIKSGLSTDKETSGEHYYSNLYRDVERYDLAQTFLRYPVLGIGFGNKYDQPMKLVPIPFPLRDWITHNAILWVLVKTGAVGFCIFWLFFNSFAFKAAMTLPKLNDPYLKALCAFTVTVIVTQLVVSNYDLQLTYYRNMVFLGTVMGLLPTIVILDNKQAKPTAPAAKETKITPIF